MQAFRAAATTAVLGVLLTATVACERPRRSEAETLDVVRDQDHVASAALVSYDDPSQGRFLRVTLDRRLPDTAVRATVKTLQQKLGDKDDPPDLEVSVDAFTASVYPGVSSLGNTDLERALWLRRDGRATSRVEAYESTVSSRAVTTAAAADVGALALDYEAAFAQQSWSRDTESIQSADRTVGVQWRSAGTNGGGTLDPDAAGRFADLQRQQPGTTGWLDCDRLSSCDAEVDLPAAVDPKSVPRLVDRTLFDDLDLGWGRFRAPADEFAATLAQRAVRARVDALRGVPGIATVTESTVEVRDRAALGRVLAYETRSNDSVRIELRREAVLYGDVSRPVFELSPLDGPRVRAAYRAVADVPAVRELDLADGGSFGNLTLDQDAAGAGLRTALDVVGGLPRPYRTTNVYAEAPGDYGRPTTVELGTATDTGFRPARAATVGATPATTALLARVTATWKAVLAAR